MKIYLTIIFLCLSTFIFGQEVEKRLSDEKLEEVSRQLCKDVAFAISNGDEMPSWQETMGNKLGFSGDSEEFSKYFNIFLNTYKNHLICPEYIATGILMPRHHLYKRILAEGLNETYEVYFFNFENGEVDFNAYEIVDGKKETLLDWIDKWIELGEGDPSELRDVGSILEEEFGLKHGSELSN